MPSGSSYNVNSCPWVPGNDSGDMEVGEVVSVHHVTDWKLMGDGAPGHTEGKALIWGWGLQMLVLAPE